jgi:hypothetical protein
VAQLPFAAESSAMGLGIHLKEQEIKYALSIIGDT